MLGCFWLDHADDLALMLLAAFMVCPDGLRQRDSLKIIAGTGAFEYGGSDVCINSS